MTIEINAQDTTVENIRRILSDLVSQAAAALEGEDVDEGVHQARKTIKRIRAVLRLVREPLGKKVYKRENQFYRDVARDLSGARDSYVLLKTLDKLVKRHKEQIDRRRIRPIRTYLQKQYEAQQAQFDETVVAQTLGQLATAQKRLSMLTVSEEGFDALQDGLRRVYSGGRVQMWMARKHPRAEHFHEWRKNVKYMWHQLELVHPMWEPTMAVFTEELHALADDLGDEHDYAVLRQTLLELPQEVGDGEVIYLLSRLIEAERTQLQRAAFRRGARIYAEDTRAFLLRLQAYWGVWMDEKDDAPIPHTVG